MGVFKAITSAIKAVASILGVASTAKTLFSEPDRPSAPMQTPVAPAAAAVPEVEAFVPERPTAIDRPETLSELAAFSPEQERSALATQGMNIGLGAQENAYYRNLLQRSLIDEGGQVAQDQNFLLPIEQQFFQRQGVDVNDPLRFLEGIR